MGRLLVAHYLDIGGQIAQLILESSFNLLPLWMSPASNTFNKYNLIQQLIQLLLFSANCGQR